VGEKKSWGEPTRSGTAITQPKANDESQKKGKRRSMRRNCEQGSKKRHHRGRDCTKESNENGRLNFRVSKFRGVEEGRMGVGDKRGGKTAPWR